MNDDRITRSHTVTVLPTCTACSKPITFYMHQDYHRGEGMHYFHPECCPTCRREREAAS